MASDIQLLDEKDEQIFEEIDEDLGQDPILKKMNEVTVRLAKSKKQVEASKNKNLIKGESFVKCKMNENDNYIQVLSGMNTDIKTKLPSTMVITDLKEERE